MAFFCDTRLSGASSISPSLCSGLRAEAITNIKAHMANETNEARNSRKWWKRKALVGLSSLCGHVWKLNIPRIVKSLKGLCHSIFSPISQTGFSMDSSELTHLLLINRYLNRSWGNHQLFRPKVFCTGCGAADNIDWLGPRISTTW